MNKADIFGQDRVSWFINIRWLAIIGVTACIILSQYIIGLHLPSVTLYLWSGAGALLFLNICFLVVKKKIHDPRRFILFQMVSDLLILAYLLYFSGGLENPLFIIFLFHIIIAGILLSQRDTYIISLITTVLFLSLVFSRYKQVVSHHTLWLLSSFILLLAGTTYFVTTIMKNLRQTNQRLAESEKLMALGQITGYIAHEVNNPIMIISSKAKLALSMKDTYIPEQVRDKLMVIDRYSERIAGVVRGLLNFISPRRELETASIDINKVIIESLNLIEARARQSQIEAAKSLDWDIPSFRGRFYEMVQVFVNIFNNAIDSMPDGGILRIETKFGRDNEIIVNVKDTGAGIRREDISRIFEPLFTTKQDGRGIGLGLSIVQSIIRSHNGTINVDSAPGEGTRFSITIPAEKKMQRAVAREEVLV